MRLTRRTAIAATVAAALPVAARAGRTRDWPVLGETVKARMAWAFDQYREHAWGKDEFKPLSAGASSFPIRHSDHHLGLTIIEALDTLWLMGLDDRFKVGVDWIRSDLDLAVDGEVSVFETSIRILGGLLSAHLASGDAALLDKAREVADRLMPAFATPTGLPYRFVNLATAAVRDPLTNPAEAGTLMAEWGLLSRLSDDPRYMDAARRAAVALFDNRSRRGLLGVKIDALTGEWRDTRATVGSYADSYYETLWDAWLLFGDAECKRMYEACTAAILRHQRVRTGADLWIADVDIHTGKVVSAEQDELSAFYGGLLAQAGDRTTGAALVQTWSRLQDRFGILPEGYDYATGRATQVTNALRPELADAAFALWLGDRDDRWREIIATHFHAMETWNRCERGYTDLADVTATPKRQADHCPGYWWSEQMKYYYLAFADCPRFDYGSNVLSTEGNVLKGLKRG